MTAPSRINGMTRAERMKICTRKNRYSDELTCRAAGLISLESRNTGYTKLWPYKCQVCSMWHMTKKPRRGVEPIMLDIQESMAA